ncbi:MAG: glucose 1-dehydrogenase [Acidobacteriaceae bacterium]|jgi:glucose 1-dehydrogenase|nr:glucose 1-dehydrogenase [Acidobacteriaceae bacterium]
MARLKDRIAVVTGSSSGIGQGIAVRFAEEGARIVVNYVGHPEGADQTVAAIQKAGGQAVICHADVTRMEDIRKLIDTSWQTYGGCDILVNNAGMDKGADFWDVTEADYDKVLAVNLKGPFFLTQYFVQKLLAADKPGRIINISSVHEDMAFPHFSTYCASKGGIRMLMRDLAVELGPKNITVNNIAPGAIITPMNAKLSDDKALLDRLLQNIPLGRIGTVDDVAGLTAFLASDEAAYITGSTYVIDGGLMRSYHEQ